MKQRRQKQIWTAMTVIFVLFMYTNSMKPASASLKESGAVLIMARNVMETFRIDSSWLTDHIIRKTAHFTEYAVFGMLLSGCIRFYSVSWGTRVMLYAFLGLFVPFLDETIQLFVEGRSGQISDIWLDCTGVFFGIVVTLLLYRLGAARREKEFGEKL